MMIKRQDGFTLVELMITMAIFVMAIAAASQIFVGLLSQFKQQSKVAESNIESVVGLELMRFDIEHAGYGLPWGLNGLSYVEAVDDANTPWDDTAYNDIDAVGVSQPPRAMIIGDSAGLNGSDVLVVKATNVATNAAAMKWTYASNINLPDGTNTTFIKTWGSSQEDLAATDHVTVLTPYIAGQQRVLINVGGNYARSTTNASSTLTFSDASTDGNYLPLDHSLGSTLIYGIAPGGTGTFISMPFNRADYYVRTPTTMPTRCAPGTGVLYKSTVNHKDGLHSEMPILDCVADMQVVVYADQSTPPVVAAPARMIGGAGMPGVGAGSAGTIRDWVKEVRVYIVAQEGQMDPSYTYTNRDKDTILGCTADDSVCIYDFDYTVGLLTTKILVKDVKVPNVNYRWKLYTLLATTYNLK